MPKCDVCGDDVTKRKSISPTGGPKRVCYSHLTREEIEQIRRNARLAGPSSSGQGNRYKIAKTPSVPMPYEYRLRRQEHKA